MESQTLRFKHKVTKTQRNYLSPDLLLKTQRIKHKCFIYFAGAICCQNFHHTTKKVESVIPKRSEESQILRCKHKVTKTQRNYLSPDLLLKTQRIKHKCFIYFAGAICRQNFHHPTKSRICHFEALPRISNFNM